MSDLLVLANLVRRFGGVTAVDDVSFAVGAGEIVGVIGPNGAGKSTLFNIASGFDRQDGGQVIFDGRRIDALPAERRAKAGLCRTFQTSQPFSDLTVEENVLVGALQKHRSVRSARQTAGEVIARMGLESLRTVKAGSLSLGNRRRLEVSRALATQPKLLLLDEVMGGLTPTEVTEIIALVKTLRDEGVTIVLIEHIMRAIMSLSDRIVVLAEGAVLAQGTPASVAKDPAVITAYLGEEYALA